ncbi:MAG: MBL fold metallo-hydrolase [Deltaproteobacteria bacterium]|nr:MAG: MBL fold metallo-hydrolase [Deltaproteobacteria bacterium]
MHLSFHGAAGDVTGSCHLVECNGTRILIDCGMFQGSRELDEDNADDFGFDPAAIDFLLLTHAHLDHCGRLPLLADRGFRGEVIATAATRELARLVLLDAAGLQEEEARYRNRRAAKRGRAGDEVEPLYTVLDALNALEHFGRTARYDQPLPLAPGISATFIDAGHILGSACIALELTEEGRRRRVLFSGDLGQSARPILRDPAPPPPADVVVMESTYGDRCHKPLQPSVEEFRAVVAATVRRGGNVIVPTFALERAQELLFYLHAGRGDGSLPEALQVFLDSPMAISATEIFKRHPECYDEETAALFRSGRDPFRFPGLHVTRETAESMAINRVTGGAVILAGAGMCTGGRVRHHLRHNLARAQCSVVIVGYAAQGTLARQLVDGAKSVTIFGEEYPVRAAVHTIGGFSAHAGQDELLAWHRRTGRPATTFLVHGEPESMAGLARLLPDTAVRTPARGERFAL